MKIIIIAREPYEIKTLEGVSNIGFANNSYILTVGTVQYTFDKAKYSLMII